MLYVFIYIAADSLACFGRQGNIFDLTSEKAAPADVGIVAVRVWNHRDDEST